MSAIRVRRRPRQLPSVGSVFAGRADAMAKLDELVAKVPVALITGTAGVGKTALAIHWAHRIRSCFPDGQLYANLRGYDPGLPATPADLLTRFLAALGVKRRDVPADLEARASLFRRLVAGRRLLVLLDNASSVEQLRPLLPGTSSCFVLVTSRDSLPDLPAACRAQRLELDLLPSPEALALLRTLIGARVSADPTASADLVRHCARLPLALRIAAELANRRGSTPLAELVLELDDRHRRLRLLQAGVTTVPAVFSWTYRQLPPAAAQLFRRLGWYPGPDIDLPAAAALAQAPDVADLVDILSRAHLVQVSQDDRVTMHDLLRTYAADLATTHDSATDRSVALSALLAHHLHTAARAIDAYVPFEPASSCGGCHPPFADAAAALAWLDAERANLIAVALYAADHGRPDHTAQLSRVLFRYLDVGAHCDDEQLLHTAALRTVDPREAMPVLGNYGAVLWRAHRYREAATHWRRALDEARRTGNRRHQARMLGNLCVTYLRLGHHAQAVALGQQAIALLHDVNSALGEGMAHEHLGTAYLQQGRHDDALRHFQSALALFRGIGAHYNAAHALSGIGLIYAGLGCHHEAQYYQRKVLTIIGNDRQPQYRARILNNIGATAHLAGAPDQAIPHHQQALALATDVGDRYEQARSHEQLARAHTALANPNAARQHRDQARTLYTSMGTPAP